MHTVINNNNAFLMAVGDGSRIELHGADAAKDSFTQITQTANAGDTELRLAEATGWEVGDRIAIAPSGADFTEDEERVIVEVRDGGRTIVLDAPLEHGHLAKVTDYDNGLTGEDYREWTLDQRAEVALLSRNVKVQGDQDSTQDGYGGHTMVMGGASQHISGVEFTRMGQIDELGRYPIHFHMNADSSGQYVENSSIHNTYNKALSVHGTFNLNIDENVMFNHIGHGLYLEDGSEHGNRITYNISFGTHASETGLPVESDMTQTSSFWLDNPANTIIGNVAAGSEKFGIWIKDVEEFHGLSRDAYNYDDIPKSYSDMVFRDNVSHSADTALFFTGTSNSSGLMYLEDTTVYSVYSQGIWTRTDDGAIMENAVFADFGLDGTQFSAGWGGSAGAIQRDVLLVGDTGNPFADDIPENYRALKIYRGAEIGIDHVHIVDNEVGVQAIGAQGFDAQMSWFDTLTFENVDYQFTHKDFTNEELEVDADGNIPSYSKRILDVDGSFTDDPWTFIVPEVGGTEGFFAPAGVARVPFEVPDRLSGHIKPGDSYLLIPAAEASVGAFNMAVRAPDGTQLQISRENGEHIAFDTHRSRVQVVTEGDRETVFLAEFSNLDTEMVTFGHSGLLEGETIIYQIPNVDSVTFARTEDETGARFQPQTAASWDEFFASDETILFQQGDTLFVRMVATLDGDDAKYGDLTPGDASAHAFTASSYIRMELEFDKTNPVGYGQASLDPTLVARAAQTDGPDRSFANSEAFPLAPTPNRADEHQLHASTSDTVEVSAGMSRWSDSDSWQNGNAPGADDVVVIREGDTMVLDQSTVVKGIVIDGGALLVEDVQDLSLVADWVAVVNGGLFQAGTEDTPFENDFTLELTGDDKGNDVDTLAYASGQMPNTVFSDTMIAAALDASSESEPTEPAQVSLEGSEQSSEDAQMEVGTLSVEQKSADEWHQIRFDQAIPDAVVVMGPLGSNDVDPATVRVRNVMETGFEFQIDEWDYLDGEHVAETLSWMAGSAGDHALSDGTNISFGRAQAGPDWSEIALTAAQFDRAPLVLTQISSDNGSSAVTPRVRGLDDDGFEFKLSNEEANKNAPLSETLDYVAIDLGGGQAPGPRGGFADVDHAFTALTDSAGGAFFANTLTTVGNNPGTLRVDDSGPTRQISFHEEQSHDAETWHYPELAGWIELETGVFDFA